MVPKLATGMAISIMLMELRRWSMPTRLKSQKMNSGRPNSFRAHMMNVWGVPSIFFSGMSAMDEPMMSSEAGTVMLPTRLTGCAMNFGACQPMHTMMTAI